jgi:DNA polymerase III gamma/tau subunit
MDTNLKFRPTKLSEVKDQSATIKSIERFINKNGEPPHSILLCGASGTGKSTIARILASMVGCKEQYLFEVNGSYYTGVEDARDLIDQLKHKSIGSNVKFLIMDEVHRLSSNAFDAFLKIAEEPPNHLFMVFVTTEPDKIPGTMLSRFTRYNFTKIKYATIVERLEEISNKEGFKVPDGAIEIIAKNADGNLRKSIKDLDKCNGAEELEEVKILLNIDTDDPQVIDLCRALTSNKKKSWNEVRGILVNLKPLNPEGIRINVANYLTACVLNTSGDSHRFLSMLETFSDPLPQQAGFAKLVVLVADCILN